MFKAKILTNTLYQLGSKIVSTASTLVVSIIITNFFGANSWGEYSIVTAYITFFYIFTEFGLNSIAAREFSNKMRIYWHDFLSFFVLRVFYTVIVICLSILILSFFNYAHNIKQAIIFTQLGLLFFSLGSSFNAVFQSKLLYKYLFFSTLIFGLINLSAFTYIFVRFNTNIPLVYLFIPMVIADLFRFLASAYFSRGLIIKHKSNVFFDKKLVSFYFFASLPLGIALVFNTLMTQVDKLMLSVMVSASDVGFYNLSYKLFDVLLVLPTFFMNATFPVLAKKFKEGINYNNSYSLAYYFLFFSSIFVTICAVIFGPIFIPLIWGVVMQPAVISFNILSLGIILFFVSSPVSWAFVVENKQQLLVYVYFFGFLLNVLLNLFFIRSYGFVGSAYATLLTEVFVVFSLEFLRRKYLKTKLKSPFKVKYNLSTLWKK